MLIRLNLCHQRRASGTHLRAASPQYDVYILFSLHCREGAGCLLRGALVNSVRCIRKHLERMKQTSSVNSALHCPLYFLLSDFFWKIKYTSRKVREKESESIKTDELIPWDDSLPKVGRNSYPGVSKWRI